MNNHQKWLLSLAFAGLLGGTQGALARDFKDLITPLAPGVPLAHPMATTDIAPPPFSLMADRPVNPAYVASMPGLPQGRVVVDDYGTKRPKYDGVFIRKSRVENGQVIIPPGGLAYLEDTWGGEVALKGEPLPVLGRMATYISYDMSIVVKENVTIPAGQSVVVGGQVYHYYATVGHESTANHALHVRTIAGTDWEWAFGSPTLSATQPGWWGQRFTQLYNQGQAREVNRERMVFDWISGVRMDRLLLADNKVFAGVAKTGQEWKVGERSIRVGEINQKAGTVKIQVLENGVVKLDRVLGPFNKERLLEDTEARNAMVFEYGDLAGYLVPGADSISADGVKLSLYSNAFSLKYGDTYARDPRFAVYPVGCPTGHNFGFMLVNKEEIRLAPGSSVDGPEKYFKIAVNKISGDKVIDWNIADKDGVRSANLGGADVVNVDLVLGQGRVAGQAILKDVGKALLVRNLSGNSVAGNGAQAGLGGLSPGLLMGMGVLLLGLMGVAFEFGRRKSAR